VNAVNKVKSTPLHRAAAKGHVQVTELLVCERTTTCSIKENTYKYQLQLRKGAVISSKDSEGTTPLHKAAFYGKPDVLKLLLKSGGNVSDRDNDGATPLHKAAFKVCANFIPFVNLI
jgi:ankyrin repeat protein